MLMAKKKKGNVIDWEEQLCLHIENEWDKGAQYCSELNQLYDDIYDLIRGERPERDYDWMSNKTLNKAFQVIWTAIPYLMQKIFGSSPIVGVKSHQKEGAVDRQKILEFWHTMQPAIDKDYTDYYLVCVMWLLRSLLNGVGYMKKTWHQKLKTVTQEMPVNIPNELDETGNITGTTPHTKKTSQQIPVEDWPHNRILNNKDVVVDWNLKPGQSIRQGRFITHRENIDLDALERTGLYDKLDEFDRNQVSTDINKEHSVNKSKDGQGDTPVSDIYTEIEAYERVGLLPVRKTDDGWEFVSDKNDTNVVQKQMTAVMGKCGDVKKLIRFVPNPYGLMNYIDMHIYFDEERWQSVGLVEPIFDSITMMNDNINAVFDETWKNLMPITIMNKASLWDMDTIKRAPGHMWMGYFPAGQSIDNAVHFQPPSSVTRDAWQKHALLEDEVQKTSVSNSMQGMGREKTATTNVLNTQMSAGKLDFILKMIEKTALIPSAQLDIVMAKKFAHPLTFMAILGHPFRFSDWEESYRYVPAASSVKLEMEKNNDIQRTTNLLSIVSNIKNPGVPKVQEILLQHILSLEGWDDVGKLLDEDFYEPSSDAGNIQMIDRMRGASNEKGIEMSGQEAQTRETANELG